MKQFLKVFGMGLLSGLACKVGGMLADAVFPEGLGKIVSKIKIKKPN